MDGSSRWKAAAAFFAASQLISYMMLGMVIGDASHDLLLQKTATSICAFFLHAMSVFALAGIAGVNWQQRYFLLQLFSTYLIVNILGLINVLLQLFGRNVSIHRLQIVAICLPSTFSVICALATGLIYREHRRGSTALLSEEEMQRRQLQRLLEDQGSAPSPELIRNTYRFDLPYAADGPEEPNSWDVLR